MIFSKEMVLRDIEALPSNYKTKDIDNLISKYVKESADVSDLRDAVLVEQRFHRIYYYVSLKQIKEPLKRFQFIHKNLFFSDWWHTDELISFVSKVDFDTAYSYAKKYVRSKDPYIRRWGYVLFISKLCRGKAAELLALMKDDKVYTVQMAEAWLIAELAVFEPKVVYKWFQGNGLKYNINGKAIKKISDSFRISDEWKEKYKSLREGLKNNR